MWRKDKNREIVKEGLVGIKARIDKGSLGGAGPLKTAVNECKEFVKKIDKKKDRELYAEIRFNQARALNELVKMGKRSEKSLGSALSCLKEALKIFSENIGSLDEVRIHYEMGISYRLKSTFENREENLKKSINSFENAMRNLSYDENPELYNNIEEQLKQLWRSY